MESFMRKNSNWRERKRGLSDTELYRAFIKYNYKTDGNDSRTILTMKRFLVNSWSYVQDSGGATSNLRIMAS